MNSESEARFGRIEATLEKLSQRDNIIEDRLDRIAEGHLELEAGQLNQQKVHTKLEEALTLFIHETRDRIDKLTILVDRLVERDLERGT